MAINDSYKYFVAVYAYYIASWRKFKQRKVRWEKYNLFYIYSMFQKVFKLQRTAN